MVKADSDKYKNMLKEVRKLCEKLNDADEPCAVCSADCF